MTEIKLDSHCRQKIAYHAKVKLGVILFYAAMTYSIGLLTAVLFTIAYIDRPYDVNSPLVRYILAGVVFALFIAVVFPLVKTIRQRFLNRADYYCHTNRFYTTSEYNLFHRVSTGARSQRNFYFAEIVYQSERKSIQLLNERHWKYLGENPFKELLFVTSESGELRPFCMAYDLIHSKDGELSGRIINIVSILISLGIGIGATYYFVDFSTYLMQYLP